MGLIKTVNHYFWVLVLLLSTLLELAMLTSWQNRFGVYKSPVVWLVAGIAFCIAAFFLTGFKKPEIPKSLKTVKWWRHLIVFGIFIIGSIYCAFQLREVFWGYPIDAKASDIIPSLQMYVQRLLSGEVVYKPLQFEGYHVDPTYFPMLWAPYIFSEVLSIDYRWTAYFVFLFVIFLYNFQLVKSSYSIFELALKALIPFFFIYRYRLFAWGTFGYAVELLPIAFYLFLMLTVFHKNRYLMALGILLCLLSRYAFTFWLPLYLLIYWIEKGFKKVFKVSLYVAAGVLLLYVIPFLSKDWSIITKGLNYYAKTASTQWETQYWQAPGEKPHHLTKGNSFAIYFYDLEELKVEERLALNKKVHIGVCAFAALLLGLGYFFFRKRGLNIKMYLLIGLKFYLLIFYGFFYVPFAYLYKLPLFLSIAVLYYIPLIQRKEPIIA